LLRVEYGGNIHPIGDIVFNPRATDASHPDWRRTYIASGDGGAGERSTPADQPLWRTSPSVACSRSNTMNSPGHSWRIS
jgi:hypothetical protein